ncbi:hypothetical protein H5410_000075 [Solanum commersonii]|uniref:Uncharacterized protein n=1 Tax=Solanum commersonii TaxID=4109 RepID=A0A9J6AUZ7_SOLCO|nr:hypothetical protein H5410_000075 [Solanum commersonii]
MCAVGAAKASCKIRPCTVRLLHVARQDIGVDLRHKAQGLYPKKRRIGNFTVESEFMSSRSKNFSRENPSSSSSETHLVKRITRASTRGNIYKPCGQHDSTSIMIIRERSPHMLPSLDRPHII